MGAGCGCGGCCRKGAAPVCGARAAAPRILEAADEFPEGDFGTASRGRILSWPRAATPPPPPTTEGSGAAGVDRARGSRAAAVVTVTVAAALPPVVGVNVTGTVSVPPEARLAGRVGVGVPRVKAPADTDRPVIEVAWLAVTVSVWVDELPTVVVGKVGIVVMVVVWCWW